MDKKTLGLMAALVLMIGFFFFLSRTMDIKQFIKFGDYTSSSSATDSGRTSFSDLLGTPTPSPTPSLSDPGSE